MRFTIYITGNCPDDWACGAQRGKTATLFQNGWVVSSTKANEDRDLEDHLGASSTLLIVPLFVSFVNILILFPLSKIADVVSSGASSRTQRGAFVVNRRKAREPLYNLTSSEGIAPEGEVAPVLQLGNYLVLKDNDPEVC